MAPIAILAVHLLLLLSAYAKIILCFDFSSCANRYRRQYHVFRAKAYPPAAIACDTGGMKKKPSPRSAPIRPAKAPPATLEGEGGGDEIPRSTIKLLRPDQVWHPKIGAPYGNQNALKPVNALHRRIADFKRRVRAALKAVP